ncbi:pentapeptide repeat-containing protein [Myxococcota bacterium]|jgi:uncharacterized protein YjbI with pentapeptide repeats|nr:pentapeptide repeat-containing protein [Myxococcota bacterium]
MLADVDFILCPPRAGRADLRGAGLLLPEGLPRWLVSGAVLSGERLAGVRAPRARWSDVDATAVDLSGAVLPFAELQDVRLAHGALRKASLTGARCLRVDLAGVDAEGVDFSGATLTDCDLTAARLVCADLRGTRFVRARLTGADLRDAWLEGAAFVDCELRFADLRGVQGRPLTAAAADRTRT